MLAFQPLSGTRITDVREQKTRKDYAMFMEELAQVYPEAEKIVLIQDNLNTHNPSSLYETFSPEKAFRLSQRFQMFYTLKRANWVNMAEIEFFALAKQCLDRRLGSLATFSEEVYAWTRERNRKKTTVSWQFTKNDARKKFNRFYLSIEN